MAVEVLDDLVATWSARTAERSLVISSDWIADKMTPYLEAEALATLR